MTKDATAKYHANSDELQALFAAMNDLVLVRDRAGRCRKILTCKTRHLLYRSPEEMLGRTLHETLPQDVADLLLAGIQETLSTGQLVKREYGLEINQEKVWFDASLSPIDDEQVMLVIRDISDRKQLEMEQEQTLKTLQDQEARLRLALELNHIGQWEWDLVRGAIAWDAQFSQLFGLAPDTPPTYEQWRGCVHPDDLPDVEQVLAATLDTQKQIRNEYRVIHPDGSLHWIAGMGAGIPNAMGQPVRFVGIVVDISDRKRVELSLQEMNAELNRRVHLQTQALQHSQARLQQREQELHTLLENNPDVLIRLDRSLRCVYANAAIYQVTGLHPAALLGQQLTELACPPALTAFWIEKIEQVLTTQASTVIYFRYPTPQGIQHSEQKYSEQKYFECKLVPEFDADGKIETILTIARDITSLKATETALRESEERFRKLFESSPIAIGLCQTMTGHLSQVNAAYSAMLGYSEAELLTMSFVEYTHPDDVRLDLQQMEQLLTGKIPNFQIEKRFIHKDGTLLWVKLTATLLRDYDQGIDYSMAMIEDITQRKQIEVALRRSEERFRSFFDQAPMPLSLADARSRQLIRVNVAYQAWLGYSYEELYSKTFLDLTHPDFVDCDRRLSERMQSGEMTQLQLQKQFIKKSGEAVWANILVTLVRNDQGQPLYSLCLSQDITEAKQLMAARDLAEASLRQQAQREQLLRSVTQRIHQSLDLDDILAITVAEARQTLGADRVLVFHLRPDGAGIVVKESVAAGFPPTQAHAWANIAICPDCYRLYQQGRPRIVLNLAEDKCSLRSAAYLESVGTQTKMTAPILQINDQGATLWGLLIVHACAARREWHPDEADLLQQIANQLAIALQQATLYQQAQHDLAERQQAEAHLRRLLEEKEILLKEVHHRVKNNLQIVSSLLRMQSRCVDADTAQLFQEAQNRVQSIATIHEHLYQSADLAHINFEAYIQILVNHLLRSYGVSSQQVTLTLRIQPLPLTLNLAIACGLIINELVSNSLKYAFCDGRPGKITICLDSAGGSNESEQNEGILTVEDDGVGIPIEMNWQTARSLGLRIVTTLVDQVNGTVTLERDRGTVFRITFPVPTA